MSGVATRSAGGAVPRGRRVGRAAHGPRRWGSGAPRPVRGELGYTWLTPGRDTDELADRFTAILVDGVRGYAAA